MIQIGETIKQALNNEQDGIELIHHMTNNLEHQTLLMHTKEGREILDSTSWQYSDTIDMFNSRFNKRLTTYHTTLSTSNNTKQVIKLSNDEVVQLYLARRVTTIHDAPHTKSIHSHSSRI
jgi:hypothetical protein